MLSEKQRRFVEAYMGESAGNATRAYRFAYGQQLDDNTAASSASALLRNPKVSEAVAERVRTDPLVASRHEIMRRLSRIVRGEDRACCELREVGGEMVKVLVAGSRVGDEIRAAELLLKIQGALVERHEHTSQAIDAKGTHLMTDSELIAKARRLHGERAQGLSDETIEQIKRRALGIGERC